MRGEISDGFGEQMSMTELDDLIRSKERLIQIQVSERSADPNVRDDLLNEARIAIWEVATKRPGAPPAYIHASTGKRITEVATRGKFTGQPSQRGKPSVDPIRRKDRDSFDDPLFVVEATAPDVLDSIEWAYHEGEIMQAICDLPERHRRYVVLRFWGGLTHVEMADDIGIKPGNMARMWTENIRPVLLDRLGHLVTT